MNPLLIKSFVAAAAITGMRIVKAGSGAVATATAVTDKLLGVSERMGAAEGGMCDVVQSGWAPVAYGGNVAFGDFLTTDDEGRAVAVPALAAGDTVQVVGKAMVAGAEGDIGNVLVSPFVLIAPAA